MPFIAAIDQGTTTTRFILTTVEGKVVAHAQYEHKQIMPRQGWVEHDPMEIWRNTRRAAGEAMASHDITEEDIAALGVTNQRERRWCGRNPRASRFTTRLCGRTPALTTTATRSGT